VANPGDKFLSEEFRPKLYHHRKTPGDF